eukprot:gene3628-4157_t
MSSASSSSMNISSDEVNFLIYKYLQESGFQHSAFTFFNESFVSKSEIAQSNDDIPHGSLVSVLQKGLQYIEVETHLQDDGTEVNCTEPFSLTSPHNCVIKKKSDKGTATAASSAKDITTKKETPPSNSSSSSGNKDASVVPTPSSSAPSTNTTDKQTKSKDKNRDKDKDVKMKDKDKESRHQNEVFICSWNPVTQMLASGSGDSTARIWTLGEVNGNTALLDSTVLKHYVEPYDPEKNIDVTTLDWNWNKRGDYLLSGSVDKTSIVWDVKTGRVVQQFEFHHAPALDVDWRTNTQFASCSTDRLIHLCEVGKHRPLMTFHGHDDEINGLKWDPSGNLLASCSDDATAKIWTTDSDECLHDLKKHVKEIYMIKWSPTGPGSANPNKRLVLASASFDSTVKVWDPESGSMLYNFTKHLDPVYTVSFSPNGEYLASGSFDKYLYIYSVKDGTMVKSFKGHGGIFDISWNNTGDRLAACFANSTVSVIDIRM